MCEWLLSGDWCDVRLMCGGRSFNAHRAVLASVSSFLRKVLLACPVDESPVCILLPDFDIDAMSSVLYYIYNGEVIIPNHKIQLFLDTASAMEIFIDQQYILQKSDFKQYCFETKTSNEIFATQNYNICQLKLRNGKNTCFINVRKGMRIEELIRQMQEPVSSLNLRNNPIQTFSWCEKILPDLGNLTSTSGCRDSQTLLRDLFIETYNQGGNVNGQTPSVLAITNEDYRAPTSDLFTDANKKHLNVCERLSDTSKRTTVINSSRNSIFKYLKELQENNYKENNTRNIKISYTVSNQFETKNFSATPVLGKGSEKEYNNDLWKNYSPLEISLPLLSRDSSSNFLSGNRHSFLNLGHRIVTSTVKSLPEVPKNCNYIVRSESSCPIAKVTILNEVLQSPWHPRQPNSYRPFRKKSTISHYESNPENKAVISCKDKNNNSGTQSTSNIKVHSDLISSEQHLNCSICQEVFTRRQDYNAHMKRHSSMSRYSCVECQKTFSQLRNFKYHMSVHRGTKEFAATCPVCGKLFNDRGYLSNHMKIHRNRKEYKCASCPKSFNQRVAFNMHVRIHTGEKPHVCEECGKAFSRKMLLKQHQRTHSGERPYACAHCDKRFADRSNMTLHLRLHTGVKPFSCTICPKSFTKKHHLKSHLNFHTGAKPYSCPRCKLAFTQSSNMRTHFKKCNGID